ncbi:MAG: hypothetical protein WBW53_09435 [Terriglobales bacterium]
MGIWITPVLLLAVPVLSAQSVPGPQSAPEQKTASAQKTTPTAASAVHHHHRRHKTLPPLVLPPLPAGPLSQLPMNDLPAVPAKVSYQDGLLTISAENSTLGQILRDVRRLTGASIDIPPNANERVVTSLGPGAPRDVLARLLNGSSFNYVMLGSNSDPNAVSAIILTSKPAEGGTTQTAANLPANPPAPPLPFRQDRPFYRQQVINPHPNGGAQADDSDDSDDDSADDSTDDQTQTPAQADANNQDQSDQPNAGPRTPEQVLEMLRNRQPGGPALIPPTPPQQ